LGIKTPEEAKNIIEKQKTGSENIRTTKSGRTGDFPLWEEMCMKS
jgi:hypothetical protein